MTYHFNLQAIVLVGVLAVILPIISRIVSSPLTLLLISPILFTLFALIYLLLNLYLAYSLDSRKTSTPDYLHRATRPFTFSTPAAWQAVLTRSQWLQNTPQSLPPLCSDSEVISAALNDIIGLIVRDFVSNWYKDLSSSPAFPIAVSSILHSSMQNLIERAAVIDISALIVKRILPNITLHVDQYRQSEVALRGAGLERRLTQSEELDILLASRYASKGTGKLHPAIDNLSTTFTKQTEEMHLRQLVEKALPYILPEKDGRSRALRIVVREIVTCSVLYPIMEMLTDPDFWNKYIDQVAGAVIHQQKLITKVRNVLEAQSPRSPVKATKQQPTPDSTERITIRTDIRQFESFLRSINRCSSLLDARRLKNDVVGEIRRTRMLLANHEKDDWINGEKTEDVVAFLDRLYTAKRKVEERIVDLGGEDDPIQTAFTDLSTQPGISLRDVLRNPSSLSYFMEFMDRRHRSLPVQFWLTVESFKNPLESVDSGSSSDEDETIRDPTASVTVKEDISMIKDLYFSSSTIHPTLNAISKKHIDVICNFVMEAHPSSTAQRRVRRSVLLAQRHVEKDMERQDFEDFEKSELWFRAVGDTDFTKGKVSSDPFAEENSSDSDESPTSPTGQRNAFLPEIPRTNSVPLFAMRRTGSSGLARSSQSLSQATNSYLPSNIEVLMAPAPDSSSDSVRAPLFNDPEDELQRAEERRMEAIQAALTDIMALEHENTDKAPMPESQYSPDKLLNTAQASSGRSRRGIFDELSPDVEYTDDGELGGHNDNDNVYGSYQPAAPGDLQLSYEISRLGEKITSLQTQELMLDNLIKKAELTGDTQELRLLTKSKSSMNREIRQLNFQKAQYEQQESANRLISDRTKVTIVSSTVGDEGGKSVVRFLIEVQQLATDGTFASGWVVARRYNEFLSMHNKLRDRYALVRSLDFPGKRLVTTLSGSFLDNRKAALEKYLQSVIAIPIVCESEELRTFLSRDSPFVAAEHKTVNDKGLSTFSGTGLVRNVYRSVAESIDDMFFGQSMLDVMIQRLTRQAAEFAGIVGSGVNDEDLVAQALNASGKSASEATLIQLSGDLKLLEGETSSSTFSAPICDLVLAVFELNKKNNWLRRQAIVIILQQVLGGTVERKMRENVKSMFEESRLMSFIGLFREGFWPGGKLKTTDVHRTAEEKIRTRDEANRKLSSLVPDLAANMIGRSNARSGARRIFAILQNRRLNQHIAYTIVDEVFSALFPESNADS